MTRGHFNVILVSQSCTDSLHIPPGSSSEKCATPSDGACNSSNPEVEGDIDVIEEHFITINKEVDVGIKQDEIPEDINLSVIKSEPEEVSSICVYVCQQTYFTSVQNYQFFFCDHISDQLKQLHCWE
jgi:hypothetical protein